MAREILDLTKVQELDVRTLTREEINKWHERMQASEDAHMQCTGDHGEAEATEFENAVVKLIVNSFWEYPKSWGWMVSFLLLGLGTGYILPWLGAGLGSLIVGHLILRGLQNV